MDYKIKFSTQHTSNEQSFVLMTSSTATLCRHFCDPQLQLHSDCQDDCFRSIVSLLLSIVANGYILSIVQFLPVLYLSTGKDGMMIVPSKNPLTIMFECITIHHRQECPCCFRDKLKFYRLDISLLTQRKNWLNFETLCACGNNLSPSAAINMPMQWHLGDKPHLLSVIPLCISH